MDNQIKLQGGSIDSGMKSLRIQNVDTIRDAIDGNKIGKSQGVEDSIQFAEGDLDHNRIERPDVPKINGVPSSNRGSRV